jgi:predicted Rossmann-fold nucleotide-binding protein
VGLLNINGFYDPLRILTRKMVTEGFLKEENRKMLLISDEINDLLDMMENYIAPSVEKWISKENNIT